MTQPEAGAALPEDARAVAGAVVGHHARDIDAELAVVGDGGLEEGGDTVAGLVGMDLDEAHAGVVIDADVDVVPAGPGRALAAVAGDAVAGLIETRELLDVQVQQLTGVLPLVTADGRGRFEGIEPVKPCPAQDAADGGGGHPHGPCDLDPRLPLEAQRRNAGNDVRGRGPGLPMRPRAAVGQALGPFGLIPGDPLAHGARTNACRGGDQAHGQAVIEHTGDQFGSTRGGGSGILMDVHSVLRDETAGFLTTSFSRRHRVDNVLKGHS